MNGRARSTLMAGAVLAITLLACAGCASSDQPGAGAGSVRSPLVPASDGFYSPGEKLIALPAVAQPFGQEPKPTVAVGPPPTSTTAVELFPGHGPSVPVTEVQGVRYLETRWRWGRPLHDSWAQHIPVEPPPSDGPAIVIYRYVELYPVGSRIEVVLPDGTDNPLVYIIDVQQAALYPRPTPTPYVSRP